MVIMSSLQGQCPKHSSHPPRGHLGPWLSGPQETSLKEENPLAAGQDNSLEICRSLVLRPSASCPLPPERALI